MREFFATAAAVCLLLLGLLIKTDTVSILRTVSEPPPPVIERVVEYDTVATTVVQYKSDLAQLVSELEYNTLVCTYVRICDGTTSIGAKPSVNALAVADRRLLGRIFWVENAPAWMQRVWVAIDSMPSEIQGQKTGMHRVDKYTWSIPKHGRDEFVIAGVRTLKGMEVIVLRYEGPTRRDLGK